MSEAPLILTSLAKEADRPHRSQRILVVSDDVQVRVLVRELLCAFGYSAAATEITTAYQATGCDVIILDATASTDCGRSFRKPCAASNAWTIVIRGERESSQSCDLEGLADFMLVKPFNPEELLLVLQRIFRDRARWQVRTALRVGPFHLEPTLKTLRNGENEIALTDVESRILTELMTTPGHLVRCERLYSQGLGRDWSPLDRCLATYVTRLRSKIRRIFRGRTPILRVCGEGYMLLVERERTA